MATTNKRFVAKNGLDNNGQTITNVGAVGTSLAMSGTGDVTIVVSGTATLTVPAGSDTLVTLTGSQTLINKTISGSNNTLSNIGNGSLTNSSVSFNGVSVALGASGTLYTDDISEDASPTNKYFTDARARGAISVTDSGGDGSLSYDSGTGVITYTGPSASEVRAHFSAGTGVTISSGQVSIGQAVATTDNVTFAGVTADVVRLGVTAAGEIDTSSGNLTIDSTGGTTVMDDDVNVTGNLQIDGNLTVSGTTVTINATNLAVEDNMIYLNNGSTVSHPDLGFAGNYNDGTYRHAGLFRDESDGVWKFFHQYTPEPDASAYIDITHASFALAPLQASSFTGTLVGAAPAGSLSGNTLASGVTASSLTSVGTLTSLTVSGATSLQSQTTMSRQAGAAVNLLFGLRSSVADIATDTAGTIRFLNAAQGSVNMSIADAGDVVIRNNLTVDTNTLYVDATNNYVGIGTASPTNTLTVSGIARFASSAGSTQGVRVYGASGSNQWDIYTNGANLRFSDNTGGGSVVIDQGATIDGNLAVDTNTLYVDATNNRVGIGTNNPTTPLEVSGTTGDVAYIRSTFATAPTVGRILHLRDNKAAVGVDSFISVGWTSSPGQDAYAGKRTTSSAGFFAIQNSSANEIFTIDLANRYVGISNTAPSVPLDVIGSSILGGTGNGNTYTTRIAGYGVTDGSTRYGSYGQLLFNANSNYTGGAKRFLLTNALDLSKFAIIRSANADTDPTIGTAGVVSSGTADFVINASGNVGIGTTDPIKKLQVNGTAQFGNVTGSAPGDAFVFANTGYNQMNITHNTSWGLLVGYGDGSISGGYHGTNHAALINVQNAPLHLGTSNAPRLTILGGGNVGIGTTSPSVLLHLNAAITIPNNRYLNFYSGEINSSNFGKSLAVSYSDDTATSQPKQIGLILHNDSSTDDTFSPALVFGSKSTSGNYSAATAMIAGRRRSTQGDVNWHKGELWFWTATDATVGGIDRGIPDGYPAMVISAGRNVGIGTTNPGNALDVVASQGYGSYASIQTAANTVVFLKLRSSAEGGARMDFANNITSLTSIQALAADVGSGSYNDGIMTFWTTKNATMSERMRIDYDGNISMYNTLSVSGNIGIPNGVQIGLNGLGSGTRLYAFGGSGQAMSLDAASTNCLYIGAFTAGSVQVPSIGTTASSANAFLDSANSNLILRSTSSARYKRNIETLEQKYADAILNLRPVWYQSLAERDNNEWGWYGLIAEEVAKIDPRIVHWGYADEDYENVIVNDNEMFQRTERRLREGAQLRPDGVQYERLSVLLLDIVRRQQARLEALETEIIELKNKTT